MKVALTGSGKIVAVCSRCDTPIRDGQPAHRFEPAQPGRRVLCEECHEAWKAKLQRALEVLSSFPEQVVDGFIAMAAGTRLAEQLEASAATQPECEGLTARWCPRCGDCTCDPDPADMDNHACPLHGSDSLHAEITPPLRDVT